MNTNLMGTNVVLSPDFQNAINNLPPAWQHTATEIAVGLVILYTFACMAGRAWTSVQAGSTAWAGIKSHIFGSSTIPTNVVVGGKTGTTTPGTPTAVLNQTTPPPGTLTNTVKPT